MIHYHITVLYTFQIHYTLSDTLFSHTIHFQIHFLDTLYTTIHYDALYTTIHYFHTRCYDTLYTLYDILYDTRR